MTGTRLRATPARARKVLPGVTGSPPEWKSGIMSGYKWSNLGVFNSPKGRTALIVFFISILYFKLSELRSACL